MKVDEAGTIKPAPPTLFKDQLTDWLTDLKTDGLDNSKKREIYSHVNGVKLLIFCTSNEQQTTSKGKTRSSGVHVNLPLILSVNDCYIPV